MVLAITRERWSHPPTTEWQVTTRGQQFPLALLMDVAPALSRLGADCHFAGTLAAGERDGQSWLTIDGLLSSVDFDSLVTEHFPHQLL